jgi:hypothetical protein
MHKEEFIMTEEMIEIYSVEIHFGHDRKEEFLASKDGLVRFASAMEDGRKFNIKFSDDYILFLNGEFVQSFTARKITNGLFGNRVENLKENGFATH